MRSVGWLITRRVLYRLSSRHVSFRWEGGRGCRMVSLPLGAVGVTRGVSTDLQTDLHSPSQPWLGGTPWSFW